MKPILENWRGFLKEDKRVVTAYHGSNVEIKNFSRDHGAQGVMWFSEDRDKIIRGESGALSSKYIMKVELNVNRTTGWQDYDKKYLKQIEDEGYDSIQLDDDWIVFDPARVKVVGIENRDNLKEVSLLREYIREILVEQVHNTLYHGTTEPAAEEIMDRGFNKALAGSKSGDPLPGVSMTIDRDIAIDHAGWAASKSNSRPALLALDASSFKLYSGNDFMELWDDLGSASAAISEIQRSGEWDGVEMFSFEREEGLEELEVLIFDYNLPVRREEAE